MLAFATGLAFALLWSAYGLRFHAGADGNDAFNRSMADQIDELTLPHWRAALHFDVDRKLLPRAYLWGLADTVRKGVEGRGTGLHFVWGRGNGRTSCGERGCGYGYISGGGGP